jgi:hypothetical protein
MRDSVAHNVRVPVFPPDQYEWATECRVPAPMDIMNSNLAQHGSALEPERLSLELSTLTREQYEALQKSSHLGISKIEADAYDKRCLRIGEICRLLGKLRSK